MKPQGEKPDEFESSISQVSLNVHLNPYNFVRISMCTILLFKFANFLVCTLKY